MRGRAFPEPASPAVAPGREEGRKFVACAGMERSACDALDIFVTPPVSYCDAAGKNALMAVGVHQNQTDGLSSVSSGRRDMFFFW